MHEIIARRYADYASRCLSASERSQNQGRVDVEGFFTMSASLSVDAVWNALLGLAFAKAGKDVDSHEDLPDSLLTLARQLANAEVCRFQANEVDLLFALDHVHMTSPAKRALIPDDLFHTIRHHGQQLAQRLLIELRQELGLSPERRT